MIIRNQKQQDYQIVQELTRQTFWNLYFPGCDRHFIIHKSRKSQLFYPDLTFVYQDNNRILGYILGKKINLTYSSGKIKQCISFGPISVHPQHQGKGIGTILINHFIEKVKQQGFKAIILQGYCSYYKRFGFKCSKQFNIKNDDGLYYADTLALQLQEGYLKQNKQEGIFTVPKQYNFSQQQLQQFDKKYQHKRKFKTKSQLYFQQSKTKKWNETIDLSYKDAINTQQLQQ